MTATPTTDLRDNTGDVLCDGRLNANIALLMESIVLDVPDGLESRRILDHVTLAVDVGELVGLTGPSGSGKSTLLAIAGGLQMPSSGSVWLNTESRTVNLAARGTHSVKSRRENIGIVFQQANLLPALTVKEQLLTMARLDRIVGWPHGGKKEVSRRAEYLLDAVGLAGYENRKPSELSGGQQARVNVARSLMNRPSLLLCDEPTAALDQETAAQVTRLITDITHESGVGTLYVTHDAGQLRSADRVLEMMDGNLTEG
ncbi:ABC transporter ATP-binding protein [Corynebacterium sp. H78]|uniref:ABC transporter ATP-binding protein n=1 Tax=Corynebacterium sp. H78 TaxID=3133417 RepID=UPI003097D89E